MLGYLKPLILVGILVTFWCANVAADRIVDRIELLEVEKYCLQNLRLWQAEYDITPSNKSCVAKIDDMGGRLMSAWISDREYLRVLKSRHVVGLVALFERNPIIEARLLKRGVENELKLD